MRLRMNNKELSYHRSRTSKLQRGAKIQKERLFYSLPLCHHKKEVHKQRKKYISKETKEKYKIQMKCICNENHGGRKRAIKVLISAKNCICSSCIEVKLS